MARDVFPSTAKTWIDGRLDDGVGGRQEVNAYLMRTYAWPLKVYFLGTNSRWLGEPDDVVNGFFADRLGRDEYIESWRASGKRLRRWLMNGFCFYLQELRRESGRRPVGEPAAEPVTFSGNPDVAVDRAAVVAFVHEAMVEAHERCREEGLELHWTVFLRHYHEGMPFRTIADDIGVDAARAQVMSRTATRKFKSALEQVLLRDGVTKDRIDEEIRSLLEVSGL